MLDIEDLVTNPFELLVSYVHNLQMTKDSWMEVGDSEHLNTTKSKDELLREILLQQFNLNRLPCLTELVRYLIDMKS